MSPFDICLALGLWLLVVVLAVGSRRKHTPEFA